MKLFELQPCWQLQGCCASLGINNLCYRAIICPFQKMVNLKKLTTFDKGKLCF